MKTELRKDTKNNLKNNFFKFMNNAVFRKTMVNVKKHRDAKLVITEESIRLRK